MRNRVSGLREVLPLLALFIVQFVCATFFLSSFVLTLLGIEHRPISWETHEILEIGAALGLFFGAIVGAILLRRSLARQKRAEEQLRQVSGAFMELMQSKFDGWALTSAEKDVALFAIKGMSTHEIAQLRGTAEGTVKAQTNAIYRKAGVSGRSQFLSLFIEDLMGDQIMPQAAEIVPMADATDGLVRAAG